MTQGEASIITVSTVLNIAHWIPHYTAKHRKLLFLGYLKRHMMKQIYITSERKVSWESNTTDMDRQRFKTKQMVIVSFL